MLQAGPAATELGHMGDAAYHPRPPCTGESHGPAAGGGCLAGGGSCCTSLPGASWNSWPRFSARSPQGAPLGALVSARPVGHLLQWWL